MFNDIFNWDHQSIVNYRYNINLQFTGYDETGWSEDTMLFRGKVSVDFHKNCGVLAEIISGCIALR